MDIEHDKKPCDEADYKPEKIVKCVAKATIIAELQTPRKGDRFTRVGEAKPGDSFEVVREETITVAVEDNNGQTVEKEQVRQHAGPTL